MGQATEQEFTAFVNARGAALLRVASALAGDRHAGEDLLQSALAKAYARWPRIRGDAEPYVRRILYNDQVSGWRRRGRRPAEVSLDALPDRAAGGHLDHDTAVRLLLQDALRTLPPRQRAVLVLRYLEDLSVEQTAEALGCQVGTVASQASRALAKLRAQVPAFDDAVTRSEALR
ncbi:SigE family RNA polymerase sigma factor [Solwaraspora sp. WMMD1047]|uniref:SigE family RNA polymerase sigma factor n=1 Tax=Solwaraspora sp. WMMD1047 TaxID=3016102 RepID=UPI002415B60C|nr:SigE family RNA polymerase sigma factor [Solwaraspora sp. WMMD1047]MDG4834747.1 SigE family RNA polymerase sigma factor [Solwaraspora sp. WMMD1047]